MGQENTTRNEENNQLIKTEPEQTQMLEFGDKNLKTVIMTIFHMFKN